MWILSKAFLNSESSRSSLEQVEAFSGVGLSGGVLCAPSSASHTQPPCLSPDRTKEFSRLSRFGMTFAHLTADRGEDVWMSSVEAFRARMCRSQDEGADSTESAPGSGERCAESLARYDHASRSWRIRRSSRGEVSDECLETFPSSGMTVGGELFQPPSAELHTNEIACGSGPLWPTPTVCGNHNRKGASRTSGDGLSTAAKVASGGADALNPDWVEWLMGWPVGWTRIDADSEQCAREWSRDPAEDDVPRLAKVTARAHRLKAIGNGQVPACVVRAVVELSAKERSNNVES